MIKSLWEYYNNSIRKLYFLGKVGLQVKVSRMCKKHNTMPTCNYARNIINTFLNSLNYPLKHLVDICTPEGSLAIFCNIHFIQRILTHTHLGCCVKPADAISCYTALVQPKFIWTKQCYLTKTASEFLVYIVKGVSSYL